MNAAGELRVSPRPRRWLALGLLLGSLIAGRVAGAAATTTAADLLAKAMKNTAVIEYRVGPKDTDIHAATAFCVDPSGVFVSVVGHGFRDDDPQHSARLIVSPAAGAPKVLAAKAWGTRLYQGYRLFTVSGATNLAALEPRTPSKWETGKAVTVIAADVAQNRAPGSATPIRSVPYTLVLAAGLGWRLQPHGAQEVPIGTTGAPILDDERELIGIVTGQQYLDSSEGLLAYLLSNQIQFEPPSIPYSRRHEKRDFTIKVQPFFLPKDQLSVELAVGSLRKGMAAYNATATGGLNYKVTAPPMDEADNQVTHAPDWRVTVRMGETIVSQLPGTFDLGGGPIIRVPRPTSGPVTITACELEQPAVNVPLPGRVEDAFQGGGGRYLLATLPDIRRLAVVDLSTAKPIKFLSLPKGRTIAVAGTQKLLLIQPDENRIERWDLQQFEMEQTAVIPHGLNVHSAAMGCASDGPALLVASTREPKPQFSCVFLDILRLSELPVSGVRGPEWKAPTARFVAQASPDGRMFTGWEPSDVVHPCYALDLGAKPPASVVVQDLRCVPASDGSVLLGASTMYGPDGQPVHRVVNGTYAAVATAPFYLHAEPTQLTICHLSDRKPLASVAKATWGWLYYVPQANVVANVHRGARAVHLQQLDLMAELEKGQKDYFFIESVPPRTVRRGQPYAYQLSARSKGGAFRYALDSGPRGMTLNEAGLLQWTAPPLAGTTVNVAVSATDAAGRVIKQTWAIAVQ
jgi:hypothetical protein